MSNKDEAPSDLIRARDVGGFDIWSLPSFDPHVPEPEPEPVEEPPVEMEEVPLEEVQPLTLEEVEVLHETLEEARRVLRCADAHARQMFIRLAAGHAQQIVPIFLFQIGFGQHIGGRGMKCAQIARVPAIAAAHCARRVFHQQYAGPGPACRNGGGKRSIAATRNQHIPDPCQVHHDTSNPQPFLGVMCKREMRLVQMRGQAGP